MAVKVSIGKASTHQAALGESYLTPASRFQAKISNQGAQRKLINGTGIQPKLRVSAPHDPYEAEADRVADQVLIGAVAGVLARPVPAIQRKCATCEEEATLQRKCSVCNEEEKLVQRKCADCEEEEKLQRKDSGSTREVDAETESTIGGLSGGSGLPLDLASDFGQRFGVDFSSVRIHTDPQAAQTARAVHARAFTLGQDIVFGSGEYSPGTATGRRLLAHELVHVVQQGHGAPQQVQRQDTDDIPGGLTPSRPGLTAPQTQPASALTVPTGLQPEPGCPRGGTNLGNLEPEPPCAQSEEIIDGPRFQFCRDSDIFKNPDDRKNVWSFAQSQSSLATFEVQAWASLEGPSSPDSARAYNLRLACHRAKRVARELVNAGVREDRIKVVAKGATDRFQSGNREKDREQNRVAVLQVERPEGRNDELPDRATLRQIADIAKARIERGEYLLGADGYIARWTCGRFHSLADMVRQTTIKVEGPDFTIDILNRPQPAPPFDEGTIGLQGLNTLLLTSDITSTDNVIGCAMNRIADLTFHHFVRPQVPDFDQQHRLALRMLALGGFEPCRRTSPPPAGDFAQPLAVDPLSGQQPPCADALLPGAISPQRQPATSRPVPTFTVNSFDVVAKNGTLSQHDQGPFIDMDSPPDAMEINAEVTAAGDSRDIPNYQVGFVQTVMSEDNVVTYVDGKKLRWRLPLPLRDGPRSDNPQHDPPWFDRNSRANARPGSFPIHMTDFPNQRVARRLIDLDRTRFITRTNFPNPSGAGQPLREDRPDLQLDLLAKNPPDRGRRSIDFNTWIAVRRIHPPAPMSRFSTDFLSGKRITFTIDSDFVATPGGETGSGTWSTSSRNASAADADSLQVRGATPADFFEFNTNVPLMNEFLVSEGAPARLQAGGHDLSQYRVDVEQIARVPRQRRGLTGPMTVTIRVSMATGRAELYNLSLSRGSKDPPQTVRIISSDASMAQADLDALARELFPRIRKLTLRSFPVPSTDTSVRDVAISLTAL